MNNMFLNDSMIALSRYRHCFCNSKVVSKIERMAWPLRLGATAHITTYIMAGWMVSIVNILDLEKCIVPNRDFFVLMEIISAI